MLAIGLRFIFFPGVLIMKLGAFALGHVVVAVVLSFGMSDVTKAAADPLASNGLSLAGNTYVLNDEAPVLEGMTSLRQTRKVVDDDKRTRRSYELKITSSKNFITSSKKELDSLEERLAVVRDAAVHNRMVARFNLLVVKVNEAAKSQEEMEEKLSRLGGPAEAKFVDDLIPLDEKAEAADQKYQKLSNDPQVKAAIAKANLGAAAPVLLGPSAAFATALKDLKKWRSEIETEAIPLVEQGGIKLVNVLLNGEPYPLIVDTGASTVALPAELGEQLKLVPGPQDPEVELKLADGRTVKGHLMTLKSVRVGRFTVENVSCVIFEKGLNGAASVLGNTFLSHFVVKLDQKADRMELTEISDKKPGTDKTDTNKPVLKSGGGD